MERKLKYMAPAILEELKIEMEGGILTSSPVVTEDTEVVSTGQEYVELTPDVDFDHNWQ